MEAMLLAVEHISIHAPRTGSDQTSAVAYRAGTHFNPRSPHGERRLSPFESRSASNFNPRSPHGERPPRTGSD